MKFLFPTVTVILTSHMKPYLQDALWSVTHQSRTDIQVLVLDSGQWAGRTDLDALRMDHVYREWATHPMVEWVFTGEAPGLIERVCPVGFVTNEAIRAGLVRGRYVCTFYDDDLYAPDFIEQMAGYLDAHPDAMAVTCSESRQTYSGEDRGGIGGYQRGPGEFDCRVDGAQIMFRREVLDRIGDPWLPEDTGRCSHSDGVFLERLADVCGRVPGIDATLVTHRFTPLSTYSPA